MEHVELEQAMPQSAQDVVNITLEEFQTTLDYSSSSIAFVNGAYLGEVFLRQVFCIVGICYQRLVKDPNISVLNDFMLSSGQSEN